MVLVDEGTLCLYLSEDTIVFASLMVSVLDYVDH